MVLSMDKWRNKIAIVTGASAGIGAAIASALVKKGLVVVGLARRPELIDNLAKQLRNEKGKLYSFKVDLTKERDILIAVEWVKEKLGPIHILVNNAAILKDSLLTEGDTQIWREIFETNVLGLSVATREAVKNMKHNSIEGHIININSIVGHSVPKGVNLNVYPASKHAVRALTESLRQELNSLGMKIRVTSLSPGVVHTGIFQTGGFSNLNSNAFPHLEPQDVADAVVFVLSTPSNVQVDELIIKPIGELY